MEGGVVEMDSSKSPTHARRCYNKKREEIYSFFFLS